MSISNPEFRKTEIMLYNSNFYVRNLQLQTKSCQNYCKKLGNQVTIFLLTFVSDLDLLPEVLLNVCFDKLIQSIRYDWRRCVIH